MSYKTKVTITLKSDTIFGSGYSIPGGEDIAVKVDREGFPYLAGETFKGLLREEVANWLDWTGDTKKLTDFFGEDGRWQGNGAKTPIYVTPFKLAGNYTNPESLFSTRTFTQIKDGMAKEGSLRVASCINKGVSFEGSVTVCSDDETDRSLLTNALLCIKYLGTDRTRGFGKVEVTADKWEKVDGIVQAAVSGNGNFLVYDLTIMEPVRVTNLASSHDTYKDNRGYIPATAIRGAVMGALTNDLSIARLLSEVRFGDAVPVKDGTVIPTPKGFYADKQGKVFYHFLKDEEVIPNTKRASLGAFAALKGDTVETWSAKEGENTRINIENQRTKNEGGMVQTGWLEAGQTMTGIVYVPDDLKDKVLTALSGEIRLGASVHSGCGLCEITPKEWVDTPPEVTAYGYKDGDTIPDTLYMELLSPLALVDEYGEPTGVTNKIIGDLLNVTVDDILCSTSVSRIDGFNRHYGTRLAPVEVYDSGSMFKIKCKSAPDIKKLRELEREGIGTRREEGFGRVLFVKDFENVTKPADESPKTGKNADTEENRRVRWLLDNSIPDGLSNSQLGGLQQLLTEIKLSGGTDREKLDKWFRDMMNKNARSEYKYRPTQKLVNSVLDDSDIPAKTIRERYQLLIDLIKLSRKGVN